ncbi:hypothetical protein NM208_g16209 [Fusarium decemcellulare]|uniref:Uncharacterized protein n=1 Tax=Fusarium decemcellulare TaxID=57161 RepID=A0ACC1RAV2_9HYPO|nr:hypothetical protein NM208_g16209 [Fusarium decemcellulare]
MSDTCIAAPERDKLSTKSSEGYHHPPHSHLRYIGASAARPKIPNEAINTINLDATARNLSRSRQFHAPMCPRDAITTMVHFTQLLLSLAIPLAASGSAIERRAVIAHDAVVGFAETVPSTTAGSLYLKYKPFLKVFNGCVPFPAVDASGNTG